MQPHLQNYAALVANSAIYCAIDDNYLYTTQLLNILYLCCVVHSFKMSNNKFLNFLLRYKHFKSRYRNFNFHVFLGW